MRTVFMGTPDFAARVLAKLCASEHSVELAITQKDRARDRGKKVKPTAVRETAESCGIEVLQPEKIKNDEETLARLKEIAPDVIVVTAYGQILPEEILKLPKYGCINVHASLLPKYRGAAPIQRAVAAGEEKSGVTIMQMDKGLDTGDMLSSVEVKIGEATGGELHDMLAEAGGELLLATLKDIEEGKASPVKQDDSQATYAPMLSKQEGRLDFTKAAEELARLVRAFDPWPGTYCLRDGEPFKVWRAEALEAAAEAPEEAARAGASEAPAAPGTVLAAGHAGIDIACGRGALRLTEVQAPGKKRMSAEDYLKGNKLQKGFIFA